MSPDVWDAISEASREVLAAVEARDPARERTARFQRAGLLDQLAATSAEYAEWATGLARIDRQRAQDRTNL